MSRIIAPPRSLVLPAGLRGTSSLWFDEIDDQVEGVALPALGQGPVTLVAWVKTGGLPPVAKGIMRVGGYTATYARLAYIRLEPTGIIGPAFYGTSVPVGETNRLELERWMRIVCSFSPEGGGTRRRSWLNGKAGATDVYAGGDVQADTPKIGRIHLAAESFGGNVADARIYLREWTQAEATADARGEAIDPTGLVRRWTCENPGFGATCREEVGGTDDPITGALWSPNVPFKRRRIVEDVPWCVAHVNTSRVVVPHAAALDPGTGEFGIMGWVWRPGVSAQQECIASKAGGWIPPAGWLLMEWAGSRDLIFKVGDGVGANTVLGTLGLLPDAEWYHVAACRSSGAAGLKIYINAALAATSASNNRNCSNAVNLEIGDMSAVGIPHHGRTSDFCYRVGSVFTPTEVAAHYFDGVLPTNPGGGVVQIGWAMREGTGVTAASVPAGFNGTLSSASWSAATRSKRRRTVEDVPWAPNLTGGTMTITVPANAAFNPGMNSFSVMFWIARVTRGASDIIFRIWSAGGEDYIQLYRLSVEGHIRFLVKDGVNAVNFPTGRILREGEWDLATAVLDRATGEMWFSVNAGPKVSVAAPPGSIDTDGNLYFAVPGTPTNGRFNDAWWWNGKALSLVERNAYFYDGIVPAADGATRIGWAMREGTGVTVASVPAGFNGTLSSASWSAATRSKRRVIIP